MYRSLLSLHPHLGLLALALGVACNRVPELEAKPAQPAALQQQAKPAEPAAPVEPVQPPAAPAAPPEEPQPYPKEGWSKLTIRETLPFCLFEDVLAREAALHIEKVKKQTLKANQPAVFGVFGPWCLNKACDDLPLLECWVDKEGDDTLVLHTHFFSYHKDGSSCGKDCMALDAMCSSPDLAPGRYTIKHGDKTYPLQIPTVLKKPCLNVP